MALPVERAGRRSAMIARAFANPLRACVGDDQRQQQVDIAQQLFRVMRYHARSNLMPKPGFPNGGLLWVT